MIDIFRLIPEKPGRTDPDIVSYNPREAYHPPHVREYRPELARFGSDPVPSTDFDAPSTGGLFDGYTELKDRPHAPAKKSAPYWIPDWQEKGYKYASQVLYELMWPGWRKEIEEMTTGEVLENGGDGIKAPSGS